MKEMNDIYSYIKPALGKVVVDAYLGIGSFIILDLKDPEKRDQADIKPWTIWVYYSAWRLETDKQFLAASEDNRRELKNNVKKLVGLSLVECKLIEPAFDTIFNFGNTLYLYLFSRHTEAQAPHWKFYTPDYHVLLIGPGQSWSYSRSDSLESKPKPSN